MASAHKILDFCSTGKSALYTSQIIGEIHTRHVIKGTNKT